MAFTWNTFWEKKTLSLFQDLIKSSIDVHDNLSGATSLFWVCLVYFCSWCIQPITIVRVVNLRLKWCLVYGSSPLSLFSFLTYMSAEPMAPQVNKPSFPSPFHLFTQPTAPSLVPKELLRDEWCTHLVMLCHTLKITFLHCILIFLFIKNISFSMLCVFCSFFALSFSALALSHSWVHANNFRTIISKKSQFPELPSGADNPQSPGLLPGKLPKFAIVLCFTRGVKTPKSRFTISWFGLTTISLLRQFSATNSPLRLMSGS